MSDGTSPLSQSPQVAGSQSLVATEARRVAPAAPRDEGAAADARPVDAEGSAAAGGHPAHSHEAALAPAPTTGSGAPSGQHVHTRHAQKPQKAKGKPAPLALPPGHDRLLLHSCCAPCSGEPMERLMEAGIAYSIFFYNPNIHPLREYEIRKEENIRFAEKHNIPFIDADYDKDNWFERVKGLEYEPERGERCTVCFDMRFERTALYAFEHGFTAISSSLGISRWKDMNQINGCGHRAAARYPGMVYWDYNWRKGGGSARMIEIAKAEHFYQQEYCGCVYSLRDTNEHRRSQGRDRIRIGELYYGMPAPGEQERSG